MKIIETLLRLDGLEYKLSIKYLIFYERDFGRVSKIARYGWPLDQPSVCRRHGVESALIGCTAICS